MEGSSGVSSFLRRYLIMMGAGIAGSVVGTRFTHAANSSWVDSPWYYGVAAATVVMSPAVLIVAAGVQGRRVVTISATAAFLSMLWMWWEFAFSSSSTAVFVFGAGWVLGVPIAVGIVGVFRHAD